MELPRAQYSQEFRKESVKETLINSPHLKSKASGLGILS